MSDVIRLLPDSVANQIAAGEVIQRPANVIKELVENAIDAGAAEVSIFVKDAGKTLIQVVDNGCGMTDTDARMAFERHATSKISKATDLFSLHTMGFRGEALPSICAISEVELRTAVAGAPMGTKLIIEASKVVSQEACVCDKGTSISVKRLFWNVPARRRFLKSDAVELSNIMREFERMALVNNNVRMLIDTGTRRLDLHPASFRQRINDLWKNNLNMQLMPVDVDVPLVKIHGFISKPEFARRRNPLQYLIVNGRNMRHPYFHRAIMNCFEGLIASDMQPCYFIKFEVEPDTIDVNIHPTKNEIKFSEEQSIWTVLTAAVKATLGRCGSPAIDFNNDALPFAPAQSGSTVKAPSERIDPAYNPFMRRPIPEPPESYHRRNRPGAEWKPTRPDSNWDKLYSNFVNAQAPEAEHGEPVNTSLPGTETESGSMCIQLAERYIVTAMENGLLIVDQHRAHVKILYERILAGSRSQQTVSQQVLFPETLKLDSAQLLALEGVEDELTRLGFKMEITEEGCRITAVPALILDKADPQDLILKVIDSVCDDSAAYGSSGSAAQSMLERVALVMARSAAIRGGTTLTAAGMEKIIADLFSLADPAYSPNGNPIYRILDESRLQQLFG